MRLNETLAGVKEGSKGMDREHWRWGHMKLALDV
jgi:hypothetical protein